MNLTLEPDVYESMLATARAAAPLEACGLLAGTGQCVTKCYVLTNADASPEHYSMKPEEQFAAIKDMRAAGLKMLGIWHSHPASPARMSAEDMRLAYTPDVAYVILSLAEPGGPSIRAFVVQDGTVHETPVIIEKQNGEPEHVRAEC
jgi:proteasome lid subunit RPN8/RPN11